MKDFLKQKRSYLALIAILFKLLLYYNLMSITGNSLVLVAFSVVFIVWVYRFFKGNIPIFIGAYFLITALMFVDVIYFKYFNRSLSVNMIGEFHLLGDVKESVLYLIGIKEILLFFDLLVIIPFLLLDQGVKKRVKLISALVVVVTMAMLIINPIGGDDASSINHQEFFMYHIKDIISVISGPTEYNVEIVIDLSDKDGKEGEYFGIAQNRNLIIIQVESLQSMLIGKAYEEQEITPVLNNLIGNDSFYFDSYFQQLGKGNTSDAEFVSQNGLYAPIFAQAYNVYSDNNYYGLPWIMKEYGYQTMVFHGYKKEFWNREVAYPGQGFDTFYHEDHFTSENPIGLGVNDVEFFIQSIDYLKKSEKPFYSFLITLTNHNPFELPVEQKKIALNTMDEDTLFGDYLNGVAYSDHAIGIFLDELKQSGLYEDSMIIIYGDHFGLNSNDQSIHENVSKFLGNSYDYEEMLRIPLIVHIPGSGVSATIETVGGQIDFMPTILNLMGITNENPFAFGRDLINSDSGFVASQTYMLKGSFIQDDIIFEMSRDGVFNNSRAWNRFTKESVDIELCRESYEQAMKEINTSAVILEKNLIAGFMDNQIDIIDLKADEGEWSMEHIEWMESAEINDLDQLYKEGVKGFGIERLRDEVHFSEVKEWLRTHPDVFIASALDFEQLRKVDQDLKRQIVPVMAKMEDYSRLEYMGFRSIIYVPDSELYTQEEIHDFIKNNVLLGVKW